jgi:hypothetical protein
MSAARVGVAIAAVAIGGCGLYFGEEDDGAPPPDAAPVVPDAPLAECNVSPGPGGVGSGSIVYAAQLGGALGTTEGTSIARRSDGDYFVAGRRNGASGDLLIVRFSPAGCARWTRTWDTPDYIEYLFGIAIASDGNPFVAGAFWDQLDLGAVTLDGTGFDGMVMKLDDSGTPQLALALTGAQDGERFYDIASSRDGESVAVVGTFDDTATFGGATVTSLGDDDIIVAKLNASGAVQWVRAFGGAGSDMPRAVTVTADGNVVVVGQTDSPSLDLGGGPLPAPSSTQRDSFILMLAADGTHRWSKRITGGAHDRARTVDDDATGIYVAGDHGGTVDFGGGLVSTTADPGNVGYVVKYSHAGESLWLTQIYSPFTVEVDGIAGNANRVVVAINALGEVTIRGQLIAGGPEAVAGLDAANGELAWAFAGTGPNSDWDVTMSQQTLLMTGGYVDGFAMGDVTMPPTSMFGLFTISVTP